MAENRDELNSLRALELLAAGALIGAGLALLLAPRSGPETRELLQERSADWVKRAQEQGSGLARRAEETVRGAQVKAQEHLAKSKEVLEDASAQFKAALKIGREAMREEMARFRSKDEPFQGG